MQDIVKESRVTKPPTFPRERERERDFMLCLEDVVRCYRVFPNERVENDSFSASCTGDRTPKWRFSNFSQFRKK